MSDEAKTLVPQRFEGIGGDTSHPEVDSAGFPQGARKDSGSDSGRGGAGCEGGRNGHGDPLPDGVRWPSTAAAIKVGPHGWMALVHGKWRRLADELGTCAACGSRFAFIANKHVGRACGRACANILTSRRNASQVGERNPHWKGKGGNYDWAEYQRLDRERHPDHHLARKLTRAAIARGEIVRQPCERCGSPKSSPHHPDYSQPLLVRWLCRKHHREAHGGRSVGREAPFVAGGPDAVEAATA